MVLLWLNPHPALWPGDNARGATRTLLSCACETCGAAYLINDSVFSRSFFLFHFSLLLASSFFFLGGGVQPSLIDQ